ncbi:MAG: low molecular weight protein arginine phosphatase [bacterium]
MPFRVLFVCSGNTCRSPLAEGIARRVLAAHANGTFAVESAGTFAETGGVASSGSLEVARENGLDLEAFQSRQLTEALLDAADLVLVMEPAHRSVVLGVRPTADTKTLLLGELSGKQGRDASVPDPFGGPIESYRRTFQRLDTLIREGLPRLFEMAERKAEEA